MFRAACTAADYALYSPDGSGCISMRQHPHGVRARSDYAHLNPALNSVNHLFSPWRSHFIASAETEPDGPSPFARAWKAAEQDAGNYLVHRGERAFIIMNLYPYNAGHLLVVPVREVADFLELEEEENLELMQLVRLGVRMLKRALAPHAFNIGMNLGRAAGAAIERHVHMHIVPRWNGDTNFMPVLSQTRVISEEMADVYARLRQARSELLEL